MIKYYHISFAYIIILYLSRKIRKTLYLCRLVSCYWFSIDLAYLLVKIKQIISIKVDFNQIMCLFCCVRFVFGSVSFQVAHSLAPPTSGRLAPSTPALPSSSPGGRGGSYLSTYLKKLYFYGQVLFLKKTFTPLNCYFCFYPRNSLDLHQISPPYDAIELITQSYFVT